MDWDSPLPEMFHMVNKPEWPKAAKSVVDDFYISLSLWTSWLIVTNTDQREPTWRCRCISSSGSLPSIPRSLCGWAMGFLLTLILRESNCLCCWAGTDLTAVDAQGRLGKAPASYCLFAWAGPERPFWQEHYSMLFIPWHKLCQCSDRSYELVLDVPSHFSPSPLVFCTFLLQNPYILLTFFSCKFTFFPVSHLGQHQNWKLGFCREVKKKKIFHFNNPQLAGEEGGG